MKRSAHRFAWLPLAALFLGALSGCAGTLPSSGPSLTAVNESSTPDIPVIVVNDAIARQVNAIHQQATFAKLLAREAPTIVIGAGDTVEVSIWESPPASLFVGGMPMQGTLPARVGGGVVIPEQMVGADGRIQVPFAGAIDAAGKTPAQVDAVITKALRGKANQPQALVRVLRNSTANVTVVGDVVNSQRMSLTAKGERVLDAVAASGGARQPPHKVMLQVTRGSTVAAMSLDSVIRDPAQNVLLQPGDVITALHQPLSFTVLGATGKNDEIAFEAQGITLSQALGRSGGLQDSRADAQGVFLFRFENPQALAGQALRQNADAKAPVVYRFDLKNPVTFLVAQHFSVRDKDVIYIANAPGAELQKFLNILSSVVYPLTNVGTIAQ